jgi:hypothetical protein
MEIVEELKDQVQTLAMKVERLSMDKVHRGNTFAAAHEEDEPLVKNEKKNRPKRAVPPPRTKSRRNKVKVNLETSMEEVKTP